MDLTGDWVAIAADDELRRVFADVGLDTTGWEPISVPGHWRRNPAFAGHDGPVFHRTEFECGAADDERTWLQFEGVFYQGDVWVDGTYLGDTEGYFAPHTFEITDAARARREHTLAVEVTCAAQRDRTAKRNLTGVFQHWDCFDPDWNPGGLWAPVRVVRTRQVRMARLRTLCTEATETRATLRFAAELDAATAVEIDLRTTVDGGDHSVPHTLAAGLNNLEWAVTVDRPRLWWPHALGPADLVDVAVEVRIDGDDGSIVSDDRRFRTGLRTIAMKNWVASVNGERLFLKGANQGPTRMALADATPDECRRDVELAVETGLDLLRLHAHIARPETYDAADEAGLLIWQDLPLQWGYAHQIRKQAMRQAAQAVDLLGHHPSVAIWCAHNEPMAVDLAPGTLDDPRRAARDGARALAAQQLPTWNKTVLDRSLKRTLHRADGTRPVIAHSGVLPHLPQLDGTDSHLYFGWYWGDERDFPGLCRTVPRMARFVSEFGAQAVPTTADFMDPARWPDLDWEHLEAHHSLQRGLLERRVPIADHDSFESWRDATQRYQATVLRHHIETLRRLKYRPTGGFAQFSFADGHPAVTWSVLDFDRVPKLGHAALAAACRPVIVVTDRLPDRVRPGDTLSVDVHVVSDRREPLDGQVEAAVAWAGGRRTWAFAGEVPPDSCVRVGTLTFEVPDAHGPLEIVLQGKVGADAVDNSDATVIVG